MFIILATGFLREKCVFLWSCTSLSFFTGSFKSESGRRGNHPIIQSFDLSLLSSSSLATDIDPGSKRLPEISIDWIIEKVAQSWSQSEWILDWYHWVTANMDTNTRLYRKLWSYLTNCLICSVRNSRTPSLSTKLLGPSQVFVSRAVGFESWHPSRATWIPRCSVPDRCVWEQIKS